MKKLLTLIFICISVYTTFGQVDHKTELYQKIISQDSLLFNVGFNTCNIAQFENLLSEDFEFFHDKDGISHKRDFIFNLKNGLCISPNTYQSRRELKKESTAIFPLYKNEKIYGAIQTGIHKFYETINGKAETYASTARFTNVWLLENNQWKLSRCLSYDHSIK